jgi:glycosyltransferase involved in cell wall biosynthesis
MTDAPRPLLSVVVPTYNRRELVLRAVQSVLAQQPAARLEVIVVDDGSTDGSADALNRSYRDDDRVRVIRSARGHASAARNRGFAAARGEFVCFLDSDDYWLADTLAVIDAAFACRPELAFVSIDGSTVAEPGAPALTRIVAGDSPGWSHPRFRSAPLATAPFALASGRRYTMLHGDFFPAIVNGDLFYLSGMVMRREAVATAGPFNERLRFFNDWEFFARLCLCGPGAYVDHDGFRRDNGRADQISRQRPLTAMARRHLFIVRSLRRRPAVAARYRDALAAALGDAEYRMAHCLAASGRQRHARMYLYRCIQRRHKPLRSSVRLVAGALGFAARGPRESNW